MGLCASNVGVLFEKGGAASKINIKNFYCIFLDLWYNKQKYVVPSGPAII